MGNQTWTSEKDCYNFAVGNGATFFQKAGSRCYVYGAGSSSGACGQECWKISTNPQTNLLTESHSNKLVGNGMGYKSWKTRTIALILQSKRARPSSNKPVVDATSTVPAVPVARVGANAGRMLLTSAKYP